MKIAEIREAISAAAWLRNDYSGHLPPEFRKANVAERLGQKIAELQSLEIAPRFAREIKQRADEIRYCNEMIARWHEVQGKPDPVEKIHHIFLSSATCIHCGVSVEDRGDSECPR